MVEREIRVYNIANDTSLSTTDLVRNIGHVINKSEKSYNFQSF